MPPRLGLALHAQRCFHGPIARKLDLTSAAALTVLKLAESGDPGHPQGKLLEAQRLNLG